MYNRIINPKTNRKVNINSKLGKYILKKYLFFINGGATNENTGATNENTEYKYIANSNQPAEAEAQARAIAVDKAAARLAVQARDATDPAAIAKSFIK